MTVINCWLPLVFYYYLYLPSIFLSPVHHHHHFHALLYLCSIPDSKLTFSTNPSHRSLPHLFGRISRILILFIYLFIHYATEAAHITLQTYKIKHKVKTQSIKNTKTLHNRETKKDGTKNSDINSLSKYIPQCLLDGIF